MLLPWKGLVPKCIFWIMCVKFVYKIPMYRLLKFLYFFSFKLVLFCCSLQTISGCLCFQGTATYFCTTLFFNCWWTKSIFFDLLLLYLSSEVKDLPYSVFIQYVAFESETLKPVSPKCLLLFLLSWDSIDASRHLYLVAHSLFVFRPWGENCCVPAVFWGAGKGTKAWPPFKCSSTL